MTVCVIGAGSAGVAMCRGLAVRGIEFDCFERGSGVGGMWLYRGDGRGTGAYASLCSNTSKGVMQFPSFPVPDDYPPYPHHRLVARYLDDYVDHHGFRDRIRFGTAVEHVARAHGGGFDVRLAGGEARRYDAVAVASGGRNGEPVYAELPGEFGGRELHSFDYHGPDEFEGRRVLVLGLGASSADIASELSRVAARTCLSVRTGHYVVPKFVQGHPIDELSPLMRRMSIELRRPLLRLALRVVHGDPRAYGLPVPPYKPGQGPLIAATELLPAIAHGRIGVKPVVDRVDVTRVRFADGSEEDFDAIVHCTGFRMSFPFLDPQLGIAGGDGPPLYHQVVHPEIGGLYFIGLLHSTMATLPCVEHQGDWVGDLLTGAVRLPPRARMWTSIRRARRRQDRRFHYTSGHLLVDPNEYERLIRRERRTHAAEPLHAAVR